ncbi:DUF4286 family protein [Neorhizobium sp. AL 9.2.2]|uniref:DUF4286 family protein n=1 Tax=Neorhizobium sp. AL 9.2.2 TaxID=2712894 RepID=UPI001572F39A|nr:DUF4286 family protein [Neorhizobium sp. AL 9.2.2]NSY18541.1 hypothetical protein [Neorhizobium sp. AL 9.2.2]
MALSGSAVLAIWNGIKSEAEDAFVSWHIQEHIPERVGLPGFLRGRRYVAVSGQPKYFNFYETEDATVLSSAAYVARLNAPTAWTRSVVSNFTDTSRTVCTVAFTQGLGDGAAIMTLQISTSLEKADFARSLGELASRLMQAPGIVGVHLLEGDTSAGGTPTAEKDLRDRPDETAAWILLIEGTDAGRLAALESDGPLSDELSIAGANADLRQGIYSLQYSLAHSQVTTTST